MLNYKTEQLVSDIESRLDIVEIIAETVKLVRKGNRFWGICPFHQEKTPSFCVSRDKQMFYCFGCHAGGNIFSFLMKRDGLLFKEALEILAAKAGVELPRNNYNYQTAATVQRKKFIQLHLTAQEFFQNSLFTESGNAARKYLQERGISTEIINRFKLGYAVPDWNALSDYLFKKGFSTELILKSGLIKKSNKNNSYYDIFRDRVIYPIFHYNGDIVGFGGRTLNNDMPKYLNSPETSIFSKRKNLYGLNQSRTGIREQNQAILVEGYMDCLKMHQAGFNNVVASLGTALTEDQASLLHRYTENVLVLYDGDEAGQRETLRAISILRNEGIRVKVLTLPDGLDPDEFINQKGKDALGLYMHNNSISHIEYKLNHYKISPESSWDSKIEVIQQLRSDIETLDSEVEKDYYISLIAKKMQIAEFSIRKDLKTGGGSKNYVKIRNKRDSSRNNSKYGDYSIQERILAAILKDHTLLDEITSCLGNNFLIKKEYKQLLSIFADLLDKNLFNTANLLRKAQERGLENELARIIAIEEDGKAADNIVINDFIYWVNKMKNKAKWNSLTNEIKHLEQKGDFNQVFKFILKLNTCFNITRKGGRI